MFIWNARRLALLAVAGLGLLGAARAMLPRTFAAAPPARAEDANTPVIRFVKNPEAAPPLQAQDLLGKPVNKDNWAGKVVLVNFWATWCPPCREELPSLDALQRTLGSRGLVVLAVSVDKDDKVYRDFLAANKVAITTARDPAQDINHEYGTLQFPESYIIDQNGKVVEKIISSTNWMDERMISHVQSML